MTQGKNTQCRRLKASRIQPAAAAMYSRENANHPTAKYLEKSVPRSIQWVPAWYQMKEHVLRILCMEIEESMRDWEDLNYKCETQMLDLHKYRMSSGRMNRELRNENGCRIYSIIRERR